MFCAAGIIGGHISITLADLHIMIYAVSFDLKAISRLGKRPTVARHRALVDHAFTLFYSRSHILAIFKDVFLRINSQMSGDKTRALFGARSGAAAEKGIGCMRLSSEGCAGLSFPPSDATTV